MWLKDYVDETKYSFMLSIYGNDFIDNLDYDNFINIYNLFKKYNFYFIDDIILNYLEIFQLDVNFVDEKIKYLRHKLGSNFVYEIGNDLRYLEIIVKDLDKFKSYFDLPNELEDDVI